VKIWKKLLQDIETWKQAGQVILTPDKANFILKLLKRDKEILFILIKGKIYQEGVTAVHIYVLNASNPVSYNKEYLL
jgi:hypothetical protein